MFIICDNLVIQFNKFPLAILIRLDGRQKNKQKIQSGDECNNSEKRIGWLKWEGRRQW